MSKKQFTFTLDEIIEHCYKVSKKKTNISKKCAAVHLQLAEWHKELKTLRQEKDGTTDSGWSLVPPNYAANCSFCRHNNGYDCPGCSNGPFKRDATTCMAFQDIRKMPKI